VHGPEGFLVVVAMRGHVAFESHALGMIARIDPEAFLQDASPELERGLGQVPEIDGDPDGVDERRGQARLLAQGQELTAAVSRQVVADVDVALRRGRPDTLLP